MKYPQDNKFHNAYAQRVREGLKSVVREILAEMHPLRNQNEGQISRESMAKKKPSK